MIQDRDDIVALDSAIIQHPRTWEASGHLAGFTDPLVQCLGKCKRRFRMDHLIEAAEERGEPTDHIVCPVCGGELSEPRAFNLMFETTIGPVKEDGLDGLPAARDGAGHLPRLQAGAAVRTPQAAVRDRAGRQVVPQRDHARELHLPDARVRADGDGVLRPAGRGRRVVRALAARALRLVRPARHRPRAPAAAGPRRRGAVALLLGDQRRRVPVPDRLVGAGGHRQPRRLRPHAARDALRREARLGRPADGRPLHPARDRAGRRRRPLDARVPLRRLRRGRDRRRAAHGAAAAPGARAGQGRGAAAAAQGRPPGEGARRLRGAAPPHEGGVRRRRRDRPALPPPGRDRHAVRRHDRPPDDRGRHGHAPRSRHARAGARPGRGPRAAAACSVERRRRDSLADMASTCRRPDLVRRPLRSAGSAATGAPRRSTSARTGASGRRTSPTSQRRAALWNYALFFWGEDSVADNLSPFIDAAPREEQKYFLATQQVDEARHAVLLQALHARGLRRRRRRRSPAAWTRSGRS